MFHVPWLHWKDWNYGDNCLGVTVERFAKKRIFQHLEQEHEDNSARHRRHSLAAVVGGF